MNCSSKVNQNAPFLQALMREISALLEELVLSGKEGAIDLRGLPLLDQDKLKLETLLGRGEVSAIVNTMGETQIAETAYSGVWWIRHMGGGDKIIFEQIAITTIPEILKTHKADIKASRQRLEMSFESQSDESQPETEKSQRQKRG